MIVKADTSAHTLCRCISYHRHTHSHTLCRCISYHRHTYSHTLCRCTSNPHHTNSHSFESPWNSNSQHHTSTHTLCRCSTALRHTRTHSCRQLTVCGLSHIDQHTQCRSNTGMYPHIYAHTSHWPTRHNHALHITCTRLILTPKQSHVTPPNLPPALQTQFHPLHVSGALHNGSHPLPLALK
jgi:hypothetical protein